MYKARKQSKEHEAWNVGQLLPKWQGNAACNAALWQAKLRPSLPQTLRCYMERHMASSHWQNQCYGIDFYGAGKGAWQRPIVDVESVLIQLRALLQPKRTYNELQQLQMQQHVDRLSELTAAQLEPHLEASFLCGLLDVQQLQQLQPLLPPALQLTFYRRLTAELPHRRYNLHCGQDVQLLQRLLQLRSRRPLPQARRLLDACFRHMCSLAESECLKFLGQLNAAQLQQLLLHLQRCYSPLSVAQQQRLQRLTRHAASLQQLSTMTTLQLPQTVQQELQELLAKPVEQPLDLQQRRCLQLLLDHVLPLRHAAQQEWLQGQSFNCTQVARLRLLLQNPSLLCDSQQLRQFLQQLQHLLLKDVAAKKKSQKYIRTSANRMSLEMSKFFAGTRGVGNNLYYGHMTLGAGEGASVAVAAARARYTAQLRQQQQQQKHQADTQANGKQQHQQQQRRTLRANEEATRNRNNNSNNNNKRVLQRTTPALDSAATRRMLLPAAQRMRGGNTRGGNRTTALQLPTSPAGKGGNKERQQLDLVAKPLLSNYRRRRAAVAGVPVTKWLLLPQRNFKQCSETSEATDSSEDGTSSTSTSNQSSKSRLSQGKRTVATLREKISSPAVAKICGRSQQQQQQQEQQQKPQQQQQQQQPQPQPQQPAPKTSLLQADDVLGTASADNSATCSAARCTQRTPDSQSSSHSDYHTTLTNSSSGLWSMGYAYDTPIKQHNFVETPVARGRKALQVRYLYRPMVRRLNNTNGTRQTRRGKKKQQQQLEAEQMVEEQSDSQSLQHTETEAEAAAAAEEQQQQPSVELHTEQETDYTPPPLL
ncbi:maker296, partial [Drosophila busckii]